MSDRARPRVTVESHAGTHVAAFAPSNTPSATADQMLAAHPQLVTRRRHRRMPITAPFLLRRLGASAMALWGALTVVFFAINATGNPVIAMVGPDATRAEIARMTHFLGYDQPMVVRYYKFLGNVLSWNFPDSLEYHVSSMGLVWQALPNSVELMAVGLTAGTVIGMFVGYTSANGRNGFTRNVPISVLVLIQALPPVLIGTLLILIFSLTLRWFPSGGQGGFDHLVLPATVLGIGVAPPVARIFRASIISIRGADHVRTALAKGVSPLQVRLRHVAANAMLPVVNLLGVQAGILLTGAFVVETLFSWPGIGNLALTSLEAQDYPVVLATVCVATMGYVLVNLLADIICAILDPRLRAV
jgi:ABC-type dipeptide/oligopeptide/nickel transport system permease component